MPARKSTGREVTGVFLGSFGFKVFMLLSLTPAGLPHPTVALSPGTTWMVNPFKGFYRGKIPFLAHLLMIFYEYAG